MWMTARTRLMKRFKLSELQATAILDMQLRRLAALERKKIETEYKEVTALIKDLEDSAQIAQAHAPGRGRGADQGQGRLRRSAPHRRSSTCRRAARPAAP